MRFLILLSVAGLLANAVAVASTNDSSPWVIEQMPGGSARFRDGVLEIDDAAGCTAWWRDKLEAPIEISYDATFISRASPHDRLSDLNCFWMARERDNDAAPYASGKRHGRFAEYDSLLTYYVGYGGNDNTTTRFRRYDGTAARPLRPDDDRRDRCFLLEPNHTYHIRLVAREGRAEYYRDGEKIFSFPDRAPLTSGWFAIRTVKSHLIVANLRIGHGAPSPEIADAASEPVTDPAAQAPELSPRAQAVLAASLAVGDHHWDDRAALLRSSEAETPDATHGIRASAWYALGLMIRHQPGDEERSLRTVRAVLRCQYTNAGAPWDGTFYRTAEEPMPPAGGRMFHEYDPNWREFIGTTMALMLIEFRDRIPAADQAAMLEGIRRAVEGELRQGRLKPTYTNIALMHGFLWAFAGQRLQRRDWLHGAEEWMDGIGKRFALHGSFDEFNSPTYAGVDLYGLALLRQHGATQRLRKLGATMEAGLWHDLAMFYHAGLLNLCGPFDRSYGMDMREYASLAGEWLALALPPERAPFPTLDEPMEHGGDFLCAPTYVLLGPQIPSDVRAQFETFQGERQVILPIADGARVATAWLGDRIAIGGEATHATRGVPDSESQFHPATIHWRLPGGGVGWIALRECPPVDAAAAKNKLTIQTKGDVIFEIHAAGAVPQLITRDLWTLPGLRLKVRTNARTFGLTKRHENLAAAYGVMTTCILETELSPEH